MDHDHDPEHDPGSRAVVRLAAVLASLQDDQYLTARLCEAARVVLEADGAALTMDFLQGNRVTLCATDEVTDRLEQLQDILGEGPAHDASRTGDIQVATIGEDTFDPWPHLGRQAVEAGLSGTFWSVPLRPARLVVGVLTLHRDRGQLGEDLPTVQFVADAVGTALLRDPRLLAPDQDVTGSWAERSRIYQATGMVVAQLLINPDDAIALLRAHAYSHDTDLYDTALDVIERRVDFTDFTVGGD